MRRRGFLQTTVAGALSPLSQALATPDKESAESWYLVAEHRVDDADVRYIVRVDGSLDAQGKQSEALFLAGDTDKKRFEDVERPDGVQARIERQLDADEAYEMFGEQIRMPVMSRVTSIHEGMTFEEAITDSDATNTARRHIPRDAELERFESITSRVSSSLLVKITTENRTPPQ